MAHIISSVGIKAVTGALSKKKSSQRLSVTRQKHIHDPLTGEVVATGPNEMYLMDRRDLKKHPLTPNEQAQRARWREACKAAQLIIRDRNHPRYRELYHRWRAQLSSPKPCKQFPNFVRAVLIGEA